MLAPKARKNAALDALAHATRFGNPVGGPAGTVGSNACSVCPFDRAVELGTDTGALEEVDDGALEEVDDGALEEIDAESAAFVVPGVDPEVVDFAPQAASIGPSPRLPAARALNRKNDRRLEFGTRFFEGI